ncbi:MAG: UDP-N-acetylglucosamine--N-acetylmuramyl-(pentapeptide) pyrophosphoryl-undecaprenol N-acetylglucosamine transferase [Pelolinea sp.]|nr:UDP-N-acetylglucosamine--N-acetylmuramyl-(pentapeptide) pyrophosphoryl-undecaprenol N-acetylglucosamine transferase [Pelolinea sp.]
MRLLICAGMTGGGVYPAIAVLQALKDKTDEVLWVGSRSGMEETLLKQYDLSFEAVSAAGLHGVSLRSLPGNLDQLARGLREARAIINRFKPQVLFLTGGYLGVPVAFAGRKIPSVVFIPDIEPGLALKAILRFTENVAVSTNKSLEFLKNMKVKVTGYPIREELIRWDRTSGRKYFGIPEKEQVLLVFGGSKGALSINQALFHSLGSLLNDMHVIHISGKDNWEDAQLVKDSLDTSLKEKYHAYPFLHEEMGAAFAAADLAVCRAGSSTLGELPYFGLPAILVPYPYAWRYQRQNAEYLQSNGSALTLEDGDLKNQLENKVRSLMNNREQLTVMRKAMKALSIPDSAQQIADMIIETGKASVSKEESNG